MQNYDIVGFGSSVLDITLEVSDEFLKENNLEKGNFLLIDDVKGKEFSELIKDKKVVLSPGGSASNIIAGVAILGGKTAFIGGLGSDIHAENYHKKTLEIGIDDKFVKKENSSTGTCMAFITPDKERTFAVNLGSSNCISKDDVEFDFNAKIIMIEGYKLEDHTGFVTATELAKYAKKINALVALDVNDAGVINRMGDKLKNFIKENVDILFMNEMEAQALTGKENEDAIAAIKNLCDFIVLKLGEDGSIIYKNGETFRIKSVKVNNLVNTNGAGDAYAAAFLFGIIHNKSIKESADLASNFASVVITKESARIDELPEDIKKLL